MFPSALSSFVPLDGSRFCFCCCFLPVVVGPVCGVARFLFFSSCLCCVAACFASVFLAWVCVGVFLSFYQVNCLNVCVFRRQALCSMRTLRRLSVRLLLCLSVRLPFLVGKGSVCTCLSASCVWPVHMRTCACVLIPFWMQAPLSARVITEFAPPSPRNLPAQNSCPR